MKPYVTHFSLNNSENKYHVYTKVDNNIQSNICHDPDTEYKIIKWLHDNDKIDATLSSLVDTNIPTLDCSMIKPKIDSVMMILKQFGICILKKYYSNDVVNIIENEFDTIFNEHSSKIEILDKENCSCDQRIFNVQKYSNPIKNIFSDDTLFNNCASRYNPNLNKKTLINKVIYNDGFTSNSGGGWHRDNHDCQFKTIMYLSNVDITNGNFQFLTNSSKKYIGYPKPRTHSYNTRFADDTIANLITSNKTELHNVLGERGTLILVDTTYIHRGNIIKSGERKAITQYFF